MTRKEANAVAAAMSGRDSGYTLTGLECRDRGEWTVTGIRQADGENVTFSTWDEWHAAANGATPTPGARLKYSEPTQQVSITVPVSVLAAADAGGRGKRSAWFVAAARAWMEREGAG